jgi:hypothetical protein
MLILCCFSRWSWWWWWRRRGRRQQTKCLPCGHRHRNMERIYYRYAIEVDNGYKDIQDNTGWNRWHDCYPSSGRISEKYSEYNDTINIIVLDDRTSMLEGGGYGFVVLLVCLLAAVLPAQGNPSRISTPSSIDDICPTDFFRFTCYYVLQVVVLYYSTWWPSCSWCATCVVMIRQ